MRPVPRRARCGGHDRAGRLPEVQSTVTAPEASVCYQCWVDTAAPVTRAGRCVSCHDALGDDRCSPYCGLCLGLRLAARLAASTNRFRCDRDTGKVGCVSYNLGRERAPDKVPGVGPAGHGSTHRACGGGGATARLRAQRRAVLRRPGAGGTGVGVKQNKRGDDWGQICPTRGSRSDLEKRTSPTSRQCDADHTDNLFHLRGCLPAILPVGNSDCALQTQGGEALLRNCMRRPIS